MKVSSLRQLLWLASLAIALPVGSLMPLVERQSGAVVHAKMLDKADDDGESDDLFLPVDAPFIDSPTFHSPVLAMAVGHAATIVRKFHHPRAPPLA